MKQVWREHASCRGMEQDIFFERTKHARLICNGCVVRQECLEEAMSFGERFGVWGGKTDRERRKIAKDIHGTPDSYIGGKCRCPECLTAHARYADRRTQR